MTLSWSSLTLLRFFTLFGALSALCLLFISSQAYYPAKRLALQVKDPSLSVNFGDRVVMHVDDTIHYQLSTPEGVAEWAQLIPKHGHLVHFSAEPDTEDANSTAVNAYTVTLFHQLKCLDIVREQYVAGDGRPPSAIVDHCMNYIRQTIICGADLTLESVKNRVGTGVRSYDTVCRDWTKVYAEAERLQVEKANYP